MIKSKTEQEDVLWDQRIIMSTHPAILKVTSKERHQKEDYKVIPQGKMSVSIKERLKYDFRQRRKNYHKIKLFLFIMWSQQIYKADIQSVSLLVQNLKYFSDYILFRKYMFLHCINYSFLIHFFCNLTFYSHVESYIKWLTFSRCKNIVSDDMATAIIFNRENKKEMMRSLCKGLNDIVHFCSHGILNTCFDFESIQRINVGLLENMKPSIDKLKVSMKLALF